MRIWVAGLCLACCSLVWCSIALAGWHDDLLSGREAIKQGHYDQAEVPLTAALHQAAPDSLDAADCLDELAKLYRLTAKYDQADSLGHQALDLRRKLRGETDPLVATSLENLGELDTIRGKYDQARLELQQTLTIRTQALGEQTAPTAETMTNLGFLDLCQCNYADGAALCEKAVDIQDKTLDADDPARAWGWDNLANARYIQSRLIESETLFKRSLDLRSRVLGDDHPDTGTAYDNLGWLYMVWGDTSSARRYFKQAQFTRAAALGADHPDTMESLGMLAEEEDNDNVAPDVTAPMMEKALAVELKVLGPSHWVTQTIQVNLADVYVKLNRNDDAEKLLLSAEDEAVKAFGPDNPNTANVDSSLADFYADTGSKPADAEKLYKRALATMEKYFGPDDRNTGFVLTRYADFLTNQNRATEAAPTEAVRPQAIQDADEKRNPLDKLEGPGL